MLRLLKKKGAYHPKHTGLSIQTKKGKEMNTETTAEQKEALMQAAWAILTKAAKERLTIRVNNFESDVQASSGIIIDWGRSQTVRWDCNLRSIKEKRCVIEAIIVKQDNTPDNRAFEMAWMGEVYNLPEEERGLNFDRVKVTKTLQQQVYDAFAND